MLTVMEQPDRSAPTDQPEQQAMKACPDCAEMVLAAARKCRYCGYQFDEPPTAPSSGPTMGSFAALLRRSTAPRPTMAQTLRQLGVELAPGERPAGLWLGQVEGDDGYVALTDRRLLFIVGLRSSKNGPAPRQHHLNSLAGAEIAPRRWKPASLVLHWFDAPALSVDRLAGKDLQALHAALLAHVGS